MILSTQTSVLSRAFGDKKALDILSQTGFDACDYSMFCMDDENHMLNSDAAVGYARELREYADSIGFSVNQAHAPFGFSPAHEEAFETEMLERLARSMEIAATLGAKIIVVHPLHFQPYRGFEQRQKEQNIRFFRALVPYCEQFGIKVACENMWRRDGRNGHIRDDVCSDEREFAEYIDEIASPWITACLDLGHCGLVGADAAQAIRTLSGRIGCLHVHDNDYVNDLHIAPYTGKMDWDSITDALAQINYKGDFTFECDSFFAGFDKELMPSAVRLIYDIGRHLIDKINA